MLTTHSLQSLTEKCPRTHPTRIDDDQGDGRARAMAKDSTKLSHTHKKDVG